MIRTLTSGRMVVGLVALGFLAPAIGAQGKLPIAVLPVSVTQQTDADLYAARALEGKLTSSLGATGRVSVLDRTQADRVASEREAQKSVDFIDSRTLAAQGQSMGALMVLTANVDKLTIGSTRLDDGSQTYTAALTVALRLIDVGTQEVKSSAVLSSDASSGGKKGLGGLMRTLLTNHATPEDAVTAAVKNLSGDLEAFYQKAFPARYTIAQVESMRPDSSEAMFLLDGGKNIGARIKMPLSVVEITEVKVGARTVKREREIGAMEIVKLDGEELSIATMKVGAREVATMLAAGKTVQAIPR
jgi:hypothetical protein